MDQNLFDSVIKTEDFLSEDVLSFLLINGDNLEDFGNFLNFTDDGTDNLSVNQFDQPLGFNNTVPTNNFNSNYFQTPFPQSITNLKREKEQSYDDDDGSDFSSHEDQQVTGKRKYKPLKRSASNQSISSSIDQHPNAGVKKRNKVSLEDIERRVFELQSENAELQAHISNVSQRTNEVQKQRVLMENLMTQIASSINEDNYLQYNDSNLLKLDEILEKYTETYADYGKCRQKEVNQS